MSGKPPYMGRGIVAGLDTSGELLVGYFAEGRSPTSRMRRLEAYEGSGRVYMNVNSETSVGEMVSNGGNPDLLLYNAIKIHPSGLIIVSNGFQTDSDPIWEGEGREAVNLKGSRPNGGIYHKILDYGNDVMDAVSGSLSDSGSEVDGLRTARIACVNQGWHPEVACMGIVTRPRKADGSFEVGDSSRTGFFDLAPGKFLMIATYGVHDPDYDAGLPPGIVRIPDYTKYVRFDSTSPEQFVDELYESLPEEILVGVAAAKRDSGAPMGFRLAAKNRQE